MNDKKALYALKKTDFMAGTDSDFERIKFAIENNHLFFNNH